MIKSLQGIFPGWRAAFRNPAEFKNYRAEFLNALAQFGISSGDLIKSGLAQARREAAEGREFMPSGAMFAKWCKVGSRAHASHKLFAPTTNALEDQGKFERAKAAHSRFLAAKRSAGL